MEGVGAPCRAHCCFLETVILFRGDEGVSDALNVLNVVITDGDDGDEKFWILSGQTRTSGGNK